MMANPQTMQGMPGVGGIGGHGMYAQQVPSDDGDVFQQQILQPQFAQPQPQFARHQQQPQFVRSFGSSPLRLTQAQRTICSLLLSGICY